MELDIMEALQYLLSFLGGASVGSFATIKWISKKNIQKAGANSKQQTAGDHANQSQKN